MYISQISISGFRNFVKSEINFNDGVNVIIGHNNAGKTSLLKALSLIIDNESSRRLEIDDFAKSATLAELKSAPPSVVVSLTIIQSENENLNSDDLVTVANWLTELTEPYTAKLTYRFFLPEDKLADYLMSMSTVSDNDEAWLTIKHEFLRFYNYRIFGGDPSLQVAADSESLQKFDYQFLNAIRDVERDMFTGRNTLLRDVLDFFMDYSIKSADEATKSASQKQSEIKTERILFSQNAKILIDHLQLRMAAGKEHILSYAHQTGATFNNAKPDFDGTVSDVDLYSALKLIIGYDALGIKIPATHNGLGYNNLIYMSLLLAKMQVNSDGNYLGSNAKVFPVLAIEEPEAHLHPSMQYKFLKFLKDNKDKRKVRQIFVTTHSTQITSAVSLDEIICLHNDGTKIHVGYPGKTFPDTPDGKKSKAYVQRFMDATRSDMLFAQKLIFVEGLAEQLLLPVIAKYCGENLEDHHIAIIPAGGRFFDNFLYLFDSNNPNAIPKKVVCIKDADPERKSKAKGGFKSCYPFEMDEDTANFEYKNHITGKVSSYKSHPNIRFYGQDHGKGKTFEYELSLCNPTSPLLITNSIANQDELLELMTMYKNNKPISDFLDELRTSTDNRRIEASILAITNSQWKDTDKKKAIIASRYLHSVGKGENALELANVLEENLNLQPPFKLFVNNSQMPALGSTLMYKGKAAERFVVPAYLRASITWICQ